MLVLPVSVSASPADKTLNLTFCCAPDNDLYVVLREAGYRCQRYTTAAEAIGKAANDSGVLLLAEGYPDRRTVVEPALLEQAAKKHLKLYIEFPDALPGVKSEPTQQSAWERIVVTSDAFGQALPRHRILMAHDCRFVPMQAQKPLLALARVAGFDTAVYGLPEQVYPLLFELPDRNLLVATTKLSAFRRGRYAPSQDWQTVWARILGMLTPNAIGIPLPYKPLVRPAYTADAKLPQNAERRAFREGVAWYRRSRLLLSASRRAEVETMLRANKATTPIPPAGVPEGDGTHGILEGYASNIEQDGTQEQLIPLRADCNAEAAMVFALDYDLNKSKSSSEVARKLLAYTFSTMQSGVRADPKHPAFGLIAWGAVAPAWEIANYGDDNARTLLGALIAVACLDTDRWDAALLKALLANLRTTGTLGFRGDRIDIPDLEKHGWRHYYDAPTVNYSPHFESYLWACYLWAYQRTRHLPFLERTKTAIRMMMQVYPQKWRWQDTTERAHMLLCLAWLVRLEDTVEHRQWLKTMASDLLMTQQPSGAIRERFAGTEGHYQVPASNASYGVGEAPLLQQDGDPVSDQLYATGFALLGLHEAVAATGDTALKQAEDRLAAYLCRIQVRSERFSFLNGAWFRAFDFRRWDYWASAADVGWGPWNAESGWGPAWINAVLALRAKQTSVWDLTAKIRIDRQLEAVQAQMALNTGEPWKPK